MLGVEYEEEIPFLPSTAYYYYKITPLDTSVKICYIGKTTNMKCREATHRTNSKSNPNYLYSTIREYGGWEQWEMKLFHKCMCDEKASIYIECAIIKQFKEQGYKMLNIQIPDNYPRQEYNKSKCKQHYAIKKECKCGWVGSKMEWSHHLNSKRHNGWLNENINEDIDKLLHA
jgi:hypothetical protein